MTQVIGARRLSSRCGCLLAFALPFAALLFLALPAAASADLTICPPGSGAGQCSNPQGIAVDSETDRLYVADRGNNRIDVFEVDEGEGEVKFDFAFGWGVETGAAAFEKCTTASGCQAGIAGFGNGQFNGPLGVAVENDPLSPAFHHLYVVDTLSLRVQKFHPDGSFVKSRTFSRGPSIAVGAGGAVYVGETRGGEPEVPFGAEPDEPFVLKLNSDLESIGECELPRKGRLDRDSLAVDSTGKIYALFNSGGIFRFEYGEPQCKGVEAPYLSVFATSFSFDPVDALYVAESISRASGGGGWRHVARYTPAGSIARRYGFGFADTTVGGIAPLTTSLGDVFASVEGSSGSVKYLSEPPLGPVVASLEADPGNVRASLEAEIDPEGKATQYQFEYLDQQSYEANGGTFAGAKKTPESPAALPGPIDFELKEHLAIARIGCEVASKAAIEAGDCLQPETLYHYRVQASNADGPGNSPVEGTFESEPAIEIEDTFASEAGSDVARFSAKVNPLGIPATGYFEYVDQADFEAGGFGNATKVPNVDEGAGELQFGAGEAGVIRGVQLALAPDTTYHMRVRATNPLLEEARTGEEVVFSTLRPEEVEICPGNQVFRGGVAGLLPDCRAYELVTPLEKEGGDIYSLGGPLEALSQASLQGDKLAFGSYRAFGDSEAAPFTAQYLAARGDSGWSSHYILGPRERVNIDFIDSVFNELRFLSPDLCRAWVKTMAEPPLAPKALTGEENLYLRGDELCGGESWEALTTAEPEHGDFGYELDVQGASADGSASIFIAPEKLKGTTAPDLGGEQLALYYQEAGEGQPRYVCHGTDGKAIATSCAAGSTFRGDAGQHYNSSLAGAISEDGVRVFFSTPAAISGQQPGQIFLRDRPGRLQSKVVAGVCTEPARACTTAVSAKGEELQGSDSSMFWWAAADGSRALYTTGDTLYEFDVEAKATREIAAGAIGVMGASADATRIYFASEEALPSAPSPLGAEPLAGEPNLYLEDQGSLRFIATLSASDVDSAFVNTAINPLPVGRRARVTSDGLHAAFISAAALSGFDNTDAKAGEADTEVFLFDASANGGGGELICASCNPSGARPRGRELSFINGTTKFWAAAVLPGWKTSLYPGRVLAEDGSRLYFEAADALVPRDGNGAFDVYQWEAVGAGGCEEADPGYSSQNGGCVELISTGQGTDDASLIDISESGDDVFFTTAQSLVSEDYGLVDVYDARVGGGLPSPPRPAPPCEGEACQAPAAPPNDPTPASAAFQGAGNVIERRAAPPRCRKGRVRRRGKCVRRKRTRRAKRGRLTKPSKAHRNQRGRQ